jgi:hypothetical protein
VGSCSTETRPRISASPSDSLQTTSDSGYPRAPTRLDLLQCTSGAQRTFGSRLLGSNLAKLLQQPKADLLRVRGGFIPVAASCESAVQSFLRNLPLCGHPRPRNLLSGARERLRDTPCGEAGEARTALSIDAQRANSGDGGHRLERQLHYGCVIVEDVQQSAWLHRGRGRLDVERGALPAARDEERSVSGPVLVESAGRQLGIRDPTERPACISAERHWSRQGHEASCPLIEKVGPRTDTDAATLEIGVTPFGGRMPERTDAPQPPHAGSGPFARTRPSAGREEGGKYGCASLLMTT